MMLSAGAARAIPSRSSTARSWRRLLGAGILVLGAVVPVAGHAQYVVNSNLDLDDAAPGDGQCDTLGNNNANPPIPPNNPPVCTLRGAIEELNAVNSPGPFTVELDPAAIQGQLITVTQPLPAITKPVTIRSMGTAYVTIAYAGSVPSGDGLALAGGDSTVQRVAVVGFKDGAGIDLIGKSGNKVFDSYVGLDYQGNRNANGIGIQISDSADNQIGADVTTARNFISGNDKMGVLITGIGSSGNRVRGNFIGTDDTGTKKVTNGQLGIVIQGASTNTVGGSTAAERNIISGNALGGITVVGGTGNRIWGNYIGSDVTGSQALGNGNTGIYLSDAPGNFIGNPVTPTGTTTASTRTAGLCGTVPPALQPPGNLIASSGGSGIGLDGAASTGNHIEGNYIGTDLSGRFDRGNGEGITLTNAPDTRIGDVLDGAGNLIAANTLTGVRIASAQAKLSRVQGNFIGTVVDGATALGNGQIGVFVDHAPGSRIGGTTDAACNLISGNGRSGSYSGVRIDGDTASGNFVQGNIIGLDRNGAKSLANSGDGVTIEDASDTLVGGLNDPPNHVLPRNIISGNGVYGVYIHATGAKGTSAKLNRVLGNFIGTSKDGTKGLGNTNAGVYVDGATDSHVGDVTEAARNVLSANGDAGVVIAGAAATGNFVQGNYIGSDVTGTAALGNKYAGIHIRGAAKNTIGGAVLVAGKPKPGDPPGNLISGNLGTGSLGAVQVEGATATGNVLQGNAIGTQKDTTRKLPNGWDGIFVTDAASNNTIGGEKPEEGNLIAFNLHKGIVIDKKSSNGASTGNAMLSNLIFSNQALGIDLDADGPNSVALRRAAGPLPPLLPGLANNHQDAPVLYLDGAGGAIYATLDSTPKTPFKVQLFSSPVGDVAGYGQGQKLLGSWDVITDDQGFALVPPPAGPPIPAPAAGEVLSATATDMNARNTSEFAKLPCQGNPIDPNLAVTAEWIEPGATPHIAQSSLSTKDILPIKWAPNTMVALRIKLTQANPNTGPQPDDLTQAFVTVTGRNQITVVNKQLLPQPQEIGGQILAESQPFDPSGSVDLPITLDSVMQALAANENQNFVEATVRVCYRGKAAEAPSTNVLHVMREKLIVFLPGLLGSKITVDDGAGKPIKAYPELTLPTLPVNNAQYLEFLPGGLGPRYKTLGLELFDQIVGWKVYDVENALNAAATKFALPDLILDGRPTTYFHLQPWPYDWRYDIDTHVGALLSGNATGNTGAPLAVTAYAAPPSLDQIVQAWQKDHPFVDDKVALAGHSTGGLIMLAALAGANKQSFASKVDRAFFINTPFYGAPKAYYAYLTGDMVSLLISQDVLRDLAPNIPIVYYLAPAPRYSDDNSQPQNVVAIYRDPQTNQLKQFARTLPLPLPGRYMGPMIKIAQGKANSTWLDGISLLADHFHDGLRNQAPIIGWRNTRVFSGTGLDTPGPIEVIPANPPNKPKPSVDWHGHKTTGDGTVPEPSLLGDAPQYASEEFQLQPDPTDPDNEIEHERAANNPFVWDKIVEALSAPYETSFQYTNQPKAYPNGAGQCPPPPPPASPSGQELFGEAEMDRVAGLEKYTKIFPTPAAPKSIKQGFDGLYCNGIYLKELTGTGHACDGTLVVGEAKGGYQGKKLDAVLGFGYGYRQATTEWARKAAEMTRASGAALQPEKDAVKLYLDAVDMGALTAVEVFHAECGKIKKPNMTRHYDATHFPP
jgi:hypothetical protein